ncbi:MAG: serine hydrolase [Patescibacteria group bacterium]
MRENHLKFLFVGIMLIFAAAGQMNKSDNKNIVKIKTEAPQKQQVLLAQLKPRIADIGRAEVLNPAEIIPIPVRNLDIKDPELNVKAALVKDLDNNMNLYALNSNLRWPLASLTKLMSAVIAIENVGLNKEAKISQSALDSEGVAGKLEKGEKYAVGELAKVMLLVSSNDAAAAIAEYYGKNDFVKQMQSKAYFLGMDQTTFGDSTGIFPANNGTADDLEILIRYILEKHPGIFKITAQEKAEIFENSKAIKKELLNINGYASSRPNFLGGKTGFTDEANGNLVSIFEYKGHKILLIVFGTSNRFEQTDILFNWVKEAYIF